MKTKIIFVCSPFKRQHKLSFWEKRQNIKNAIKYCQTIIDNGMIPIAPHLYFPKMLNDNNLKDRTIGMSMGLELMKHCDFVYVYGPRISSGMQIEIDKARKLGIPIIEKVEVIDDDKRRIRR